MSPPLPSPALAAEQESHYQRVRAAAHALTQHRVRLHHAIYYAFPEHRGGVRVHGALARIATASGYHRNRVRSIRDGGPPPEPEAHTGLPPSDQESHYARVRAAAEAGSADDLRVRLHHAIYYAFPEHRGGVRVAGVIARLAWESGYDRYYVRQIRDGDPPPPGEGAR